MNNTKDNHFKRNLEGKFETMLASSLLWEIIKGTPIAFQGVNVSILKVKIIFTLKSFSIGWFSISFVSLP